MPLNYGVSRLQAQDGAHGSWLDWGRRHFYLDVVVLLKDETDSFDFVVNGVRQSIPGETFLEKRMIKYARSRTQPPGCSYVLDT